MEVEKERRFKTRRAKDRDVCALHKNLCLQCNEAKEEVKKKVPLWFIPVSVLVLLFILGADIMSGRAKISELKKIVINNAKTLDEVRMNQRLMQKSLSIEYEYYDYKK